MPIRKVKQHSDRGKIKNLSQEPEMAPEPFELRMKKLYEYAQQHNDKQLRASVGFITTDYIGDKTVLPLSAYRIRQVVDDIKSKAPAAIERLSLEIAGCLSEELSVEASKYLDVRRAIKKTASARKPPVFWRVSR